MTDDLPLTWNVIADETDDHLLNANTELTAALEAIGNDLAEEGPDPIAARIEIARLIDQAKALTVQAQRALRRHTER